MKQLSKKAKNVLFKAQPKAREKRAFREEWEAITQLPASQHARYGA